VDTTQSLACPICAAPAVVDPTTYTERACAVCGCGLVLRPALEADGEPLAWQVACRCMICRQVIEPGHGGVTGLMDVPCPHCGARLWALESD
jgi:hypothetical protein